MAGASPVVGVAPDVVVEVDAAAVDVDAAEVDDEGDDVAVVAGGAVVEVADVGFSDEPHPTKNSSAAAHIDAVRPRLHLERDLCGTSVGTMAAGNMELASARPIVLESMVDRGRSRFQGLWALRGAPRVCGPSPLVSDRRLSHPLGVGRRSMLVALVVIALLGFGGGFAWVVARNSADREWWGPRRPRRPRAPTPQHRFRPSSRRRPCAPRARPARQHRRRSLRSRPASLSERVRPVRECWPSSAD